MEQVQWVLLLTCLSCVLRCSCLNDNSLPLIWPSIGSDRSYHIIYQVEMFESEQTLSMEEWADFDNHLFRLDVMAVDGKTSIVTNGQTGEVMYYKPFACGVLTEDSELHVELSKLFKGYPMNQAKPETKAYGFGPLWLSARVNSDQIEQVPSVNPTEGTKYRIFSEYRSFLIKFKPDGDEHFNYDLKFYFEPVDDKFVYAIEWVTTDRDGKQTVGARAKHSAIDTYRFSNQVFELPIGYGCKRGPDFDHGLDIELGKELLHATLPNQVNLDVTMIRSSDNLMHSWESDKYAVQMVRGQLRSGSSDKLGVYYATSTQYRDPKTSRYSRIKRVWSSRDELDEAVVHTIDETKGSCSTDHVVARDFVRFPFPGQEGSERPISLSAGLLRDLFRDEDDFHLIRMVEAVGTKKFKDTYYEKRVEAFELKDGEQTTWKGPVSIVKHINYLGDMDTLDRQITQSSRVQLSTDYSTSIILFFFSDDYKSLRFKVVIEILSSQDISMHQLLDQLDISPCVGEDKTADIIIKYPIRDPKALPLLYENKDFILAEFARNLFMQTPIPPLQVTRIRLTSDQFFAYLRMSLLDLSSYQTFDVARGRRLVQGDRRNSIMAMMASTLAACSRHCDYYGCFRFSYDASRFKCRLELLENTATDEPHPSSDLYSFPPEQSDCKMSSAVKPYCYSRDAESSHASRHHLSPQLIVEMLESIIELTRNEEDVSSIGTFEPDGILNLWYETVGTTEPGIHLKPMAVLSDLDSLSGLVRQEEVEGRKSEGLKLQYELIMEDSCFHPSHGQEFEAATYEVCAMMCESEDCRAFSYCPNSLQCTIAIRVQSIADIQSKVTKATNCDIYTLDSLSKFEDYGYARYPTRTKKKTVAAGQTARDCATNCMEESGFNCQGFYFCEDRGSKTVMSSDCFLQDNHISGAYDRHRPRLQPSGDTVGAKCRYYSRSYLAQFDQFHGKAIETSSLVIKGSGAEECARRCIEDNCLIFDVCVQLDSELFTQSCRIASESVKSNHLVAKKQCTSFSLSDRSQFNKRKKSLIEQGPKPDKIALDERGQAQEIVLSEENVEAERQDINHESLQLLEDDRGKDSLETSKAGHYIAKITSFFVGTLVGAGGVYLANEVYVRTSRRNIY